MYEVSSPPGKVRAIVRSVEGDSNSMSMVSRLAPVLVMSALLSGCSDSSSSRPWEPPAAPEAQTITTFGRPVPSADYAKLQAAGQVRSVDPCALINPDSLSRYGAVVTAGPRRALSECVVNVVIAGRRPTADVTVDLASEGPFPEDQSLVVAGETVVSDSIRTSGYSCGYQVPMRFRSPAGPQTETTAVPDIVELPPVPYMLVTASGFGSADGGDCAVAQGVIGGIVAAFAEERVPRRDQAPTRIALAERGPCELLDHFPQQYSAERFDVTTAPYHCRIWVDGEIVDLRFTTADADMAMRPISDRRVENIAGYPVLLSEDADWPGGSRCVFDFPVGSVFDGSRPGPAAPSSVREDARVQPMGSLSGECPVTRALMPAALELFGANR
jgi:hypothetical protein